MQVIKDFQKYRKEAVGNITGDEGILLRKNRSIQVEGAFGVIKQDMGFRRFLVRGKKDIETQLLVLSFAFNVQKLYNRKNSDRFGKDLFLEKTP